MIDPTAMSRFTALREAAGKIDRLVPHVRLMEQPPHESRDTASGICFTFTVSKMWVTEDAE